MKTAAWVLALILCAAPAWAMGSAPDRNPDRTSGGASRDVVEPKGVDLGLEQAYHLALRRNEDVAIGDEAVERVKGDVWEAWGDGLGSIDYVYTDFRQDEQGPSASSSTDGSSSVGGTLTSKTRSEGKLVIEQPIFRGLKEISALQGAGSLHRQRLWEKKQVRNDLFLEVAASYYGLIRAREDADTIERILSLIGDRLNELTEREKIGRSRPSERATASARKKVIEADYASAKGSLAIAEHRFVYFTGADPSQNNLADSGAEPPASPDAPANAAETVEGRPDVEAVRAAMETARTAIAVKRTELFPTADLTANLYNKREGFQKDIQWDLEFLFDIPVFDGGTSWGHWKKALSDYETAKLVYERTRRLAELDLKERWEEWVASRDRYQALRDAVAESEENFKLQKDEYTHSLVSNLDVLSALEDLLESQRNEITARYEMKINRWRYEISKGSCCESV